MLVRLINNACQEFMKKGIGDMQAGGWQYQGQGVGSSLLELQGGNIRFVAEFLCCLDDSFACFRADVIVASQRPRYGRHRSPHFSGNILNRDSQSRLLKSN